MSKSFLLVPFDPVHDVGIRLIGQLLEKKNQKVILLPPDLPAEEIARKASEESFDAILISRTMGYGVAEILAKLVDLLDAVGVRTKSKLIVGGMAVTPELAAELGFDKGFSSSVPLDKVIAYILDMPEEELDSGDSKRKADITEIYSYEIKHKKIESLLEQLVDGIIDWGKNKTSDGITRAYLRREIIHASDNERYKPREKYISLCDSTISEFYQTGNAILKTRLMNPGEAEVLKNLERAAICRRIKHTGKEPKLIIFCGSGCPVMDAAHIMAAGEWGVDGIILVDPSWSARYEGLMEGLVAQEEDGTILTYDNLEVIYSSLRPNMYFQIRGHRGLNIVEQAIFASEFKVDFGKINPFYGSLHGGSDPARLMRDSMESMKILSEAGIPFDMPANDELSGVPAHKCFAGMLVTMALGRRLGARPILKPLFCFGPYAMLNGQMDNNYIDYNAGKFMALREIVDAPIWCGEPIGFNTHEDERVQSATTTALHAGLASSLGADALTFASTDEAYSRGPIVMSSRIDTFQSLRTMFRFLGDSKITPTPKAGQFKKEVIDGIEAELRKAVEFPNCVESLYNQCFGTVEEGAKPGRAGVDTVKILE